MTKKLLCLALTVCALGCAPAVDEDEPQGVYNSDPEVLRVSPDQPPLVYNLLNYSTRNKAHAGIVKEFHVRENSRAEYVIKGENIEPFLCLDNKDRSDFDLYASTTSGRMKLSSGKPFVLSPGDILRVVVDNTAGCEMISIRFAVVRRN